MNDFHYHSLALIELMIAITFLGMLTAFALAGRSPWIVNKRARSIAGGLRNRLMDDPASGIALTAMRSGLRPRRSCRTRPQDGVALLEALIAILIFSFGVIGLVSAQAAAIKTAGDAKLRTDAGYLAGQIISRMWVDRANLPDYAHMTGGGNCSFSGSAATSANVTEWLGNATQPGSVGYLPNGAAQIVVETGTNMVTVTVCWRTPQETVTHNYTTTALISG